MSGYNFTCIDRMKSLKESLIIESRFSLSQDNAYLLASLMSILMNGDIKNEDLIKAAEDGGGKEVVAAVQRMLKDKESMQRLEDDLYNTKF